jgi:hypothetical protein
MLSAYIRIGQSANLTFKLIYLCFFKRGARPGKSAFSNLYFNTARRPDFFR